MVINFLKFVLNQKELGHESPQKKPVKGTTLLLIFFLQLSVSLYNSISKEKYNGDPQIPVESDLQI